jgi:hypothetical protein
MKNKSIFLVSLGLFTGLFAWYRSALISGAQEQARKLHQYKQDNNKE